MTDTFDRTLPQTAQSVFRIKSFQEIPFGESDRGPKLTKGNFVISYAGELKGEGILEELKVHFIDKRISVYGLQRVTGELCGMAGTFVLKHEGRFQNGKIYSRQTVVPGSATGGLRGLRGEINLETGPAEEFPVMFQYYFA
jgi:hypothetical protein